MSYFYIASYPKSGNTWVRIFIKYLHLIKDCKGDFRNKNFHIDINNNLNTGEIYSSRSWIDEIIGIDSSDLSSIEISKLRSKIGRKKPIYSEKLNYIKVHDSFKDGNNIKIIDSKGCKGAVYIVRHPYDVACSLSNFFEWNLDDSIKFIIDKNACLTRQKNSLKYQVPQHLGNWSSHVESWLNQKSLPILMVRYEDLHLKKLETFTKISNFLNLSNNSDEIKIAINNSSFKKLKKFEIKNNGFTGSVKVKRQFFNKGEVGVGKRILSDSQKKIINGYCYDTIEKVFQ